MLDRAWLAVSKGHNWQRKETPPNLALLDKVMLIVIINQCIVPTSFQNFAVIIVYCLLPL